jgi:hypothetical protein
MTTKATICLLDGVETSVEVALHMRSKAKSQQQRLPVFTCTECGELVDPHAAGKGSPAHFEHRTRNPGDALQSIFPTRKAVPFIASVS